MPYMRVSQAGLKDFPGFFVTAQLHVEQGFSREATIEKIDILRGDLNEGGRDGS
jgi:hypothetical protein